MHYKVKLALALSITALLLGGCMRVPDDIPQLATCATAGVLGMA